ncbi:uncharacterized protein EI90DRAFT_3043335 [Cantharellus anzutake]|uniref:uncharacterized protein n=1 Tax=Cantharellus anzutake TaxID=1750568 RepID=UPI001904C7AA|nr:uncharacterized protein EI90DRAFT_3043335 [Cantharellus anzutake]KAF8337544.1 hypothetical protein EI90DRAFT_3043335 [Cantharellus anzutake]
MAPVGIPASLTNVIVGPLLIGSWLNIWLYGMMLIQAQAYYRHAQNDPAWIKYLVAFILLADTFNSVFDAWFTYHYAVLEFGNPNTIMVSNWVFNTDPIMTVIISSTVQAFFGWRVKRLTGITWLAAIIVISAVIQFLAGLGTTIGCAIVKEFVQFRSFKSIVIVWLVLAPVTDFLIAASLAWYLRSHKTGFATTDDIVIRITRLTIQTGAITVIWATTDLVVFLVWPNNLHLIFNMPLAKLYGNCLMSSLNARREWSTSGLGYTTSDGISRGQPRGGISITTKTEVVQDAIELDVTSKHRPQDGAPRSVRPSTAAGGGAAIGVGVPVHNSKHDDGLSLHSDSIDGDDSSSQKPNGGRKAEWPSRSL